MYPSRCWLKAALLFNLRHSQTQLNQSTLVSKFCTLNGGYWSSFFMTTWTLTRRLLHTTYHARQLFTSDNAANKILFNYFLLLTLLYLLFIIKNGFTSYVSTSLLTTCYTLSSSTSSKGKGSGEKKQTLW